MTECRFNHFLALTQLALIPVFLILSAPMQRENSLFAHESNKHVIRHDALLTVGTKNIDLELELTFFAASSATERTRMDMDNDGIILEEEAAAYIDQLASVVRERVRILVDDQPLDTLLLYHPELDLLGEDVSQPYPHLLRLFFFARTPIWIKGGSLITVEDTFWPEVVGIYSLKAEGIEGFEVVATRVETSVSRDGGPYLSSAQCLRVASRSSDADSN